MASLHWWARLLVAPRSRPQQAYIATSLILFATVLLVGCEEISVTPASGPAGAERLVLDIAGTNMTFSQGRTTARFLRDGEHSGIAVEGLEVLDPGALRLTISIPPEEPTGPQILRLRSGSDQAETTFLITDRPTISLAPGSAEQGTDAARLVMKGAGTSFDPATFAAVVQAEGVEVVSWSVVDRITAEVRLNVGLNAVVGVHPGALRVYTDNQWLPTDFTILSAPGRSISVNPDSGVGGQNVNVTVTGTKTNFLNAANVSVDPPDDVDIVSITVLGKFELSVVLGIHSNAVTGQRQLVVNDGSGDLSDYFTILEDSTPPTFVGNPSYGLPGNNIVVQVTGSYTSFDTSTTVELDPPVSGVTATLLSVLSPTSATLELDVDDSVQPQSLGIVLTTGLEHAQGSFDILPPPTVELDPDAWYQREAVTVEVTGSDTHFLEGQTEVSVPPGSKVTIVDYQVTGSDAITLDLLVGIDATGIVPISFVDSWGLPAQANFTILPGRPAVELSPMGLPPGSHNVGVTASIYFLDWEDGLTISVEPDCAQFLEVLDSLPLHPSSSTMVFHMNVSLLAPVRSCLLDFTSASSSEHATTTFQILPGYTLVSVPSEVTWNLTEPTIFAVDLATDDVLRARVARDLFTFVDPVLELHSGDGTQLETLLAENDDESSATMNARIVFRAPSSGRYYLLVKDRLGFNEGDVTLSVDWYEPEVEEEVDAGDGTELADLLGSRLLRGQFEQGGGDATDVYEVDWSSLSLPHAAGDRVLVQVIALGVSPFETSGADLVMQIYDPLGTPGTIVSEAAFGPDPALFVDTAALGFIALGNEGPDNTTYWLSLRPAVVINEVFHDEERAWEASFVELHGEPGFDLSTCELRALAADAQGPLPAPVFAISLAGRALGPAGYHVVGHDELVPGVTADEAVPELLINDPGEALTDVALVLECAGTVFDAVCYRGGSLAVCEGTPAQDTGPRGLTPGHSIGRGFHVDTDRNDVDFLPQVEPSPWQRNFSEVW